MRGLDAFLHGGTDRMLADQDAEQGAIDRLLDKVHELAPDDLYKLADRVIGADRVADDICDAMRGWESDKIQAAAKASGVRL